MNVNFLSNDIFGFEFEKEKRTTIIIKYSMERIKFYD